MVLGVVNTTNAIIEINSLPAFTWGLEGMLAFGATNLPVQAGSNEYLAVVSDLFGRAATNAVSVHVADHLYAHDLNGNLTNDGVRAYSWDQADRLIEVKDLQTSEVLVQNRYDGLSRRRERVQREDGAMVTNRYVYDGWLVVAVLDGENDVLEQYVHGIDLSGTREGAGGIGGLLSVIQSGTTNYFHYDGNGNVASLTDNDGTIVTRLEYDPFGRVLLADGDYTPRYQFSSKEYDEPTGLNYYGYRFLNPELGRWTQRDPIEEQGGLNLYGFVDNNPVLKFDPLGQKACNASDIEQCKALCKAQFKEYLGCKKYLVCVYPVWPPPSYNKVYYVKCSCSKKLCFFTHADPSLVKKGWYDCHYACAGDQSKTIMAPTKEGCPKTIAD